VSKKGMETIKVLKLDREELNLSRRTHFELLDALITIVRLLARNPQPEAIQAVRDAQIRLSAAKGTGAVFSAASQDYLVAHGM